jgi:hypothetical protein
MGMGMGTWRAYDALPACRRIGGRKHHPPPIGQRYMRVITGVWPSSQSVRSVPLLQISCASERQSLLFVNSL